MSPKQINVHVENVARFMFNSLTRKVDVMVMLRPYASFDGCFPPFSIQRRSNRGRQLSLKKNGLDFLILYKHNFAY